MKKKCIGWLDLCLSSKISVINISSIIARFSTCIMFTFMIAFRLYAQDTLTLSQAVQRALMQNLSLKQLELSEKSADEDLRQAKFNRLPSLLGYTQSSYNFGRTPNLATYTFSNQSFLYTNANITAQFTLFQGGQLKNQIVQNKLLLDEQKASLYKAKYDLTVNVLTTYLQILTYQDLTKASARQLDLSAQLAAQSEKLLSAGRQNTVDASRARASLASARSSLLSAQQQLDLNILLLKQYMEMDSIKELVLASPALLRDTSLDGYKDVNSLLAQAFPANPDLELARIQQAAAENQVRIAKGLYYPTINMTATAASSYASTLNTQISGVTQTVQQITVPGYGQSVAQIIPVYTTIPYSATRQFLDNFNQSVGLTAQIPIFNHHLAQTSVSKAKIALENSRLATQIAGNNLRKILSQACADLRAAAEKLHVAESTYDVNSSVFAAVKKRFAVGLVNSLEYEIALNDLNKAQNDLILSKYEVIFKKKIIDFFIGKLDVTD